MFLRVSVTLCDMDKESKVRAGRAVARAMAQHGWDVTDLARIAEIPDAATVRKLVEVGTWPRPGTREKIEIALGWATGDMYRAASGALDESDGGPSDSVVAAIEASDLSKGDQHELLSRYFKMRERMDDAG